MASRATRRGVVLACALGAPALFCDRAAAEVKTRVRADGTLEIYNDGPSTSLSSARTLRLRPVPRAEYGDWIREHAGRHGLDPRLVQAIVQVESGYNSRAASRAGAVGLMQLMPGTARALQVGDRYNPEQNIRGGVAYLRQMIDLFSGRLELAIAAYNAGPGAVQRYNGIPPYAETRDYVDRVLTLYRGGSSSILVGFGGGGGTPQLNGLAQEVSQSSLQQALAGGTLRLAPQPVMAAAPAPLARPTAAPSLATAVPAVMRTPPVAAPAAAPRAPMVVPASLPIVAEPVAMQPATGG